MLVLNAADGFAQSTESAPSKSFPSQPGAGATAAGPPAPPAPAPVPPPPAPASSASSQVPATPAPPPPGAWQGGAYPIPPWMDPNVDPNERARAYAAWQASYREWATGREPERHWYGWQTLLVDAVTVGFWIGGAAAEDSRSTRSAGDVLLVGGFIGYLLGAPIVHAAHGHWGKAGGSFAFRAGTSIVGIIGAAECSSSSRCKGAGQALLILGGLGIPASIAVDAAVIAREDVVPGEEAKLTLSPWVNVATRGAGLGVRGGF